MSGIETLNALFADLAGKRIAGGCGTCNAYQTARIDEEGIYRVTVHHSDWCVEWARHREAPSPALHALFADLLARHRRAGR